MCNRKAIFFLGLLIVLPLGVMGQVVPPPLPPPPPPGLSVDQGEYFFLMVALVFGIIEIRKGKN